MSGRLVGIAWRPRRLAPMQTRRQRRDQSGGGRRRRPQGRQVQAARGDDPGARGLGGSARAMLGGDQSLDWTPRRANLLVEGVRLPRALGATLRIGPVLLEVTYPTTPCARMDEAREGLRKALHPEWRGGVTCKVLEGGHVALGDAVADRAVAAGATDPSPRLTSASPLRHPGTCCRDPLGCEVSSSATRSCPDGCATARRRTPCARSSRG